MTSKQEKLIEGKDYTIENGFWVFSASFLLRRGYCCDSGCRNCPYPKGEGVRVVSMVPSWTETLIECGVEVVGRTRYCIHPKGQVESIPIVGGTKDLRRKALQNTGAQLLILDREENPKSMFENSEMPCTVSHIKSLANVGPFLLQLSGPLKNQALADMANRWNRVTEKVLLREATTTSEAPKTLEASGTSDGTRIVEATTGFSFGGSDLPGVIQWIRKPDQAIEKVLYLIWRNPWMAVSKDTFIGSVLSAVGCNDQQISFSESYPKINLQDYDPQTTLLLFSSEPYDFAKETEALSDLGFPAALVNGESFSWFGSRTLKFLEAFLER